MFKRLFDKKAIAIKTSHLDVTARGNRPLGGSYAKELDFTLSELQQEQFEKCDRFTVGVCRDWVKGVSVGDVFRVNHRGAEVAQVFDPFPDRQEGYHDLIITFRMD